MSIDRESLHRVLSQLTFEPGRWVVAGSAPMLMAGLIDSISDIDLVVDQAAWRQAVSVGQPRVGLFGNHIVELDVGGVQVEVFDGWLGATAEELIAAAVEVDGCRLMPLDRVLESKRRLSRQKDAYHIDVLEAHLENRPTAGGASNER